MKEFTSTLNSLKKEKPIQHNSASKKIVIIKSSRELDLNILISGEGSPPLVQYDPDLVEIKDIP